MIKKIEHLRKAKYVILSQRNDTKDIFALDVSLVDSPEEGKKRLRENYLYMHQIKYAALAKVLVEVREQKNDKRKA